MEDRELYDIARKAKEGAYAPYSGFRVGAALLTDSGKVYTGVNVENSSYGGTICAERTACVKAVSEGETTFVKMAVCGGEGLASPCGICRQFLYEFSPDMEIITGADRDHLEAVSLRELLPAGFALERRLP